MRILYIDIDTLRPDHLGCYGYHRETSPNLDRIASQGVRFENCYVSDAPCLPSRASMFTGQFGIHTGIINHGGRCADPRPVGRDRGFNNVANPWNPRVRPGLIESLRRAGLYPVSVSPFATRHAAWWFYAGWREMTDTGRGGDESAEEVVPAALDWIERNAKRENWMLHVNIWDPHTPYRAPEEFGNPFADEPIDPWYTEEIRQAQWDGFGAGSPQEPGGNLAAGGANPRQPGQIASLDDYKAFIDGYDCGVRYGDEWIGRLLNALADKNVLDETLILVTSDHGENLGELAVHGDHQTADHITSRVPMILRLPDQSQAGRVDSALHYQSDVGATLLELAGGTVPAHWDGQSFAPALQAGTEQGRNYLVAANNAWSCQRSVRWGDCMYIRSYNTGLKSYPREMLFDIVEDPHETANLAEAEPALLAQGRAMLDEWTHQMLSGQDWGDPMRIVLDEGGPFHTRDNGKSYCQRLRQTGRARHADFLDAHPDGLAQQ
jgi:arylsulfatase A-like enzyme